MRQRTAQNLHVAT